MSANLFVKLYLDYWAIGKCSSFDLARALSKNFIALCSAIHSYTAYTSICKRRSLHITYTQPQASLSTFAGSFSRRCLSQCGWSRHIKCPSGDWGTCWLCCRHAKTLRGAPHYSRGRWCCGFVGLRGSQGTGCTHQSSEWDGERLKHGCHFHHFDWRGQLRPNLGELFARSPCGYCQVLRDCLYTWTSIKP